MAALLPSARFIAYESNNHLIPVSDPVWPEVERDLFEFLALHA